MPAAPTPRTLLAIDFSNLAHRAYHAGLKSGMSAPSGESTFLLSLMCSMIFSQIEQFRPTHVAVAFDSMGPTWRREVFATYKGHRKDAPEDLYPQMTRATQAMRILGFARYRAEGHEADDALATIAANAIRDGFSQVWILSGDKDMLSIVSDRVTVLTPPGFPGQPWTVVTPEWVANKYGLSVEQMVDLKALVGDSSDGYPGCPGIGEKTAVSLISKYGTLDGIYEHLDEITPAHVAAKLRNGADSARLCQRLATLSAELELSSGPDSGWDPTVGRVGSDEVATTAAYLDSLALKRVAARWNDIRTFEHARSI